MQAQPSCKRQAFQAFHRVDPQPILSERVVLDHVRIQYLSRQTILDQRDSTHVWLRWYPNASELWITSIRVSTECRRRGLGRRLVTACETLAAELGAESIQLFSLFQAIGFWRKLGYRAGNSTRRLSKTIVQEGSAACFSCEPGD